MTEKTSVSNPRAECCSRNSITLSWKAEPDNKRFVYMLQVKHTIKGWITVYWGYSTKHVVKNLGPEECYYFRVKATTYGSSVWSAVAAAKTADGPVPVVNLYRAIQHGKPQLARKILYARPGVADIPDRTGTTSLIQAIKLGDIQMVTLLLNAGADMNNIRDGVGRTPLMVACFLGYTDIVHLLSERGAKWYIQDRNGCTALHYAVDNSQIEPLEYVLEHGADVECKDSQGWTPLMRAVIMQSDSKILETLMHHGASIHVTDKKGNTCLIQAILSGQLPVVKLLLQAGVNMDVHNFNGNSAISIAKGRELKEIVDTLVPVTVDKPEEN